MIAKLDRAKLIKLAIAIAAAVTLFFYPSYQQNLVNAIGADNTAAQFVPTVFNMVVICVYVVMAIGLNMVVGYAGLLDLGYVAFYAVGAYVAGWFATQQFSQVTFHFGDVGSTSTVPGIHISIWLLMVAAEFYYQSVPPVWLGALRALEGEAAQRFVRIYDAADKSPERVARAVRRER